MVDQQRFARLSSRADEGRGRFAVPDDGMCLSAYVVLHPSRVPRQALLGRMDPEGPWERVACLDPERVRAIGDRWVLPATQLRFFEGPDEAAARIAADLLGRRDLKLGAPKVFSETYARPTGAADPHWDLQFVYSAPWPQGATLPAPGALWRELKFVDVATTRPEAFGRGHGDILALIGLEPGTRSTR
jgi:ADP-ribose pyrophosphatase YjhB (NUDIX family)